MHHRRVAASLRKKEENTIPQKDKDENTKNSETTSNKNQSR
jgi:hypothetical protein